MIAIRIVKCLRISGALDITMVFFLCQIPFCAIPLADLLKYLLSFFLFFFLNILSLLVGIDCSATLINKHVRSTTENPFEL